MDGLNGDYPINPLAEPEGNLEIKDCGVGVHINPKGIQDMVDTVLSSNMNRANFDNKFKGPNCLDFEAELDAITNGFILESVISICNGENQGISKFHFSVNPMFFKIDESDHPSAKELLQRFFPRMEDCFELGKVKKIYDAIGMPEFQSNLRLNILRELAYRIELKAKTEENGYLNAENFIGKNRSDILFRIEQFIEAINQIQCTFGPIEQAKVIREVRIMNLRIPKEVYSQNFVWLQSRDLDFISLQTSAQFENGILLRTQSGQDIFIDLWPKKSFDKRTPGQQLAEFTRWMILNGHLNSNKTVITNFVNNQYFLSSLKNLHILRFLNNGNFELVQPTKIFWESIEKLAKVTEIVLMKKETFKNMYPKEERATKEA